MIDYDFFFVKFQEAIKCMRHSRRTILTTDDVDGALNLRNVEVIWHQCNFMFPF